MSGELEQKQRLGRAGVPADHGGESPSFPIRFGPYELDANAGQLLKNRRAVRIKPQPFKLLQLLVSKPGEVVGREEIRTVLWGTETFVDFEQGVNTAIKQIRDALNEDADHPLYVETVPKRGYRFIAPIEPPPGSPVVKQALTDLKLHKALWLNIAELRLAEQRRRARRRQIVVGSVIAAVVLLVALAAYVLI
jgi:DNA-binding winged helix-turn-helix (wHTH) protein